MKNAPESCVFERLVSPLVVLLGRFVEPLEGKALLEEVHHWEWALEFHSFTPFPVHSQLLPTCG